MKINNYKKIFFFTFLFLIIFSLSLQITQAVEFKPNVRIPGTEFASVVNFEETTGTYYVARYVRAIYDYGISIGAILATVVLMAAGVIWLTSGGSQDKIGQAKNMISGSIIGLLLLFGSYTILNLVNPELVNFHVSDIPAIGKLQSSTYCNNKVGTIEVLADNLEEKDGKIYDKNEKKLLGEVCTGNQVCVLEDDVEQNPEYRCRKIGCCQAFVDGGSSADEWYFSKIYQNSNNCPVGNSVKTSDIEFSGQFNSDYLTAEVTWYPNVSNRVSVTFSNGMKCDN